MFVGDALAHRIGLPIVRQPPWRSEQEHQIAEQISARSEMRYRLIHGLPCGLDWKPGRLKA